MDLVNLVVLDATTTSEAYAQSQGGGGAKRTEEQNLVRMAPNAWKTFFGDPPKMVSAD